MSAGLSHEDNEKICAVEEMVVIDDGYVDEDSRITC